tara:strand:- start:598 stop:777 length:180 start_codon:yes stop_codon:yes gene_type:complete
MTDIEKYKSVAIKIDAYQKAKPMAEKMYMSMGSFIRYLIDKEENKPTLQNGEDNHVRTE